MQATERGIIFYKFGDGLDKENIFQPGFHLKAPWNDLIVFEVSEVTAEEKMDINDKNGLPIHVDVTVRYTPYNNKIGHIYEKFRNEYANRLVIPEVRSMTRQVLARYTAEEIYSTKRAEVENTVKSETEKVLNANFIDAKAVLIRSIQLPEQIRKQLKANYNRNRRHWLISTAGKKKVKQKERESQLKASAGQ